MKELEEQTNQITPLGPIGLFEFSVTPVNDAPVASDDIAEVPEDGTVTITVLDNDTDIDGDLLTLRHASSPHGDVRVNLDGTLTFEPAPDFTGQATITYTIASPDGLEDQATVLVTVTPVNDAPVASDDIAEVPEDGTVTITVLDNDTDIDGDLLTLRHASSPHGDVRVNLDGTLTFEPAPDFTGQATITYTIASPDGLEDQATVLVTVTPVNDAPVASDDIAEVPEDGTVTITVLDNDTDIDGDLLTLRHASSPHGDVRVNLDGTLTFEPAPDFTGQATITYTIASPDGLEDQATVLVTVTPVNDAPVASDDIAEVPEDGTVTITVLDNDTDIDGDLLTLRHASSPHGDVRVNLDGTLTFEPAPDFTGQATITYTIASPDGLEDQATVLVTVTPMNDAPVASDDIAEVPEDGTVTITVLDNDTDIDGDLLTLRHASSPHGDVRVNLDGTLTFEPAPDFTGQATITYTIASPDGLEDQATVLVTVTPVNDAPVASDDIAEVPEDGTVTITVLDNDTDIDGDLLTLRHASSPHGDVRVNLDGTLTFEPAPDFTGQATITYTIASPDGLEDQATVLVTVTPVNDAPVASDDIAEVPEDGTVTITVLDNDTDIDGDLLTLRHASSPHGDVRINSDGTLTFEPAPDFTGQATITYTIASPDGLEDQATVLVTVTPMNDAPVASDDIAEVPEDGTVTITVLDNDTDIDGDLLTLRHASSPHGDVRINSDGTLTFEPAPDFTGQATITYTIASPDGLEDQATVLVTVTPVNDAPVASDDIAEVPEDGTVTITVLDNDTDIDGDLLTLRHASSPHGDVRVNLDGTLTFEPAPDFTGQATITYTIASPDGLEDQATVLVTVTPVNDAPVASDDIAEVPEDGTVTITVLDNDTDIDGDLLTLRHASSPHGDVRINSDGTLTFEPAPDFTGQATITYTIASPDGLEDQATVLVTVTPVNDAPVASDDIAEVPEDGTVTITVLDNDTDIDGDLLTLRHASSPHGDVRVNLDGTLTFEPAPDFTGQATITYTIASPDGLEDQATVLVTVTPVNDAPVASDDIAEVPEDGTVTITVLDNDTDIDGDLLTLRHASSPHGDVRINSDGTLTFEPAPDFTGQATITYTIASPDGLEDQATVLVTVTPVNDAPVASDDIAEVPEDGTVTITVLDNDTDIDGDLLTLRHASSPHGDVRINSDGTLTFEPAPDFTGQATITYTIASPDGLEDQATVLVTVTPVNDAPVASDDIAEVPEDGTVTITVLDNDTDIDGDLLTLRHASSPHGDVRINSDGTLTFEPAPDFTGQATITYTIASPDGLEDQATVLVTVTPVNDAPVASDDIAEVPEDGTVTITVLDNDTDIDGDLLTLRHASSPHGDVRINSDGTLTFEPAPDFTGQATITYTIASPDGLEDQATVLVTVTPMNDAPVASDDIAEVPEDGTVTITVLDNDTDIDGDLLTLRHASSPHGDVRINSDGTLTFEPAPDFTGQATITYTIASPDGLEDQATVLVTVTPVNDAPVASDDIAEVPEDGTVTITVLDNDTDIDGDLLTLRHASSPHGDVRINSDGTLTFEPAPDFTGQATITYTIASPDGLEDQATVLVTVTPMNDAPVASDDIAEVPEDGTVTITVLDNDTDIDGDLLTLRHASSPHGDVRINSDGTLTFEPAPDFTGQATITYTIASPDGLEDQATVLVTVTPVNDAPVASDDIAEVPEDGTVTITVLDNDTDIDGDLLTLRHASSPHGDVRVNLDGTLTFEPAPDFTGQATITYTIASPDGLEDQATVLVTVTPMNDAPVASDDIAEVPEDGTVTITVLDNDTDIDGDLLTLRHASSPHGDVRINSDGTLTFEPAPDFTGQATITYTIASPDGLEDQATVLVTVTPMNDAPVASDDIAEVPEDGTVTITVLDNDTDIDGDLLTLRHASSPHGDVRINSDGTLTFEPAPDFTGQATITYTIASPDGLEDQATVLVTVTPVNDAPVASDDIAEVPEDGTVTITVLDNDTDIDGDLLTLRHASSPHGDVRVNLDGTLTFEPAPDFTGQATITYTIASPDGLEDQATVLVTVTPVNDAPVASDDIAEVPEDGTVTITVLDNDTDIDGDLLTLRHASSPHGDVRINSDGTLTFEPAPDFTGQATITYTIASPDGLEDQATVLVTVTPVNDAPVASDDIAEVPEDGTVTITVLDNDTDIDGDLLTLRHASSPHGDVRINSDGTLTFEPAPDFTGQATITYTIASPDGLEDQATVLVTVTPVNDAPVASDDIAEVPEDGTVTITVLDNDTDIDGDLLTLRHASSPHGDVRINSDGTLTFEPAPDFTGQATITYTIASPDGLEDQATVLVTVTPMNDAPVASDDIAEVPEDGTVTITVLDNDTDIDGDLLTLRHASSPHGDVRINSDGTLTFEPAPDFTGQATITYTIASPDGLEDQATVLVTVTPVNDAPVASDDIAEVPEDGTVTITVLDNDTDIDGDLLTLRHASSPHGDVRINSDGTLTFEPAPDFTGQATITYTIASPDGLEDQATVLVTVTPVNDAPVSTAAIAGRMTTLHLDSEDINEIEILDKPAYGNVTVNPDNSLAMVLSNTSETDDLGFNVRLTYTDGTSTDHLVSVAVSPGDQGAGWGHGSFYMLETDTEGDLIVETGETHRKVYVSGDDGALTLADIALIEDLDFTEDSQWASFLLENPEYGSGEHIALAEDAGSILWNTITQAATGGHSNWLLLERGHTYEELKLSAWQDGESELHPVYVGAYGEGTRPVFNSHINVVARAYNPIENTVFDGITLAGGGRFLSMENFLLNDVIITDEEFTIGLSNGVTLHDSHIYDVYHETPVVEADTWLPNENRISGLYVSGTDGLLIENTFFDHNGWADGYSYDMSTEYGQSPSKFSHNLYLASSNLDVTVRDNIFMRAASSGAQIRPGGMVEDNVFIDNNGAFLVSRGGDQGATNYSLVNGNLVTSAGHKVAASHVGEVSFGITNQGMTATLIDNIVTHLADPANPTEFLEKDSGQYALINRYDDPHYDNTMIYNWQGSVYKSNHGFHEDRYVDDLDSTVLDETTIQNFTADLLGQETANIEDLANYLRAEAEGALDDTVDADVINAFFKEAFGLDTTLRDTPDTLRFIPNDLGDGFRWDNRLNWSTDDLPGTQDGDRVELGGNWVHYAGAGTVEIKDLDFGSDGRLDMASGGKLTVTHDISVGADGAALHIDMASQFWANGYTGQDLLTIDVEGGRFANTGLWTGTSNLTASDNAQILLAAGTGDYVMGAGSTLTLQGGETRVGFDGTDEDIGVLLMSDIATLEYIAENGAFGQIGEINSGAFGDARGDVASGANLGGATLQVDATDLAGTSGTYDLLSVDEMIGTFGDVEIIGLDTTAQDAVLYVDYDTDTVQLHLGTPGTGNGAVRVEHLGDEDTAMSATALYDALTNGHGIYSEDFDATGMSSEVVTDPFLL